MSDRPPGRRHFSRRLRRRPAPGDVAVDNLTRPEDGRGRWSSGRGEEEEPVTTTSPEMITVKAVVQDGHGAAEDVLRLEEIDPPEIGDDEVLVRVGAAGVDRGVWHLATGLLCPVRLAGHGLRAPEQRVPGSDVAGRVEATGRAVTRLRTCDAVSGLGAGSCADLARAREAPATR